MYNGLKKKIVLYGGTALLLGGLAAFGGCTYDKGKVEPTKVEAPDFRITKIPFRIFPEESVEGVRERAHNLVRARGESWNPITQESIINIINEKNKGILSEENLEEAIETAKIVREEGLSYEIKISVPYLEFSDEK